MNASITVKLYSGEYKLILSLKKRELEQAVKDGYFVF